MRQQLKHTKTANFQQIPQLHKNTQFPTKTNKLTQNQTISHKNTQFPTKTNNFQQKHTTKSNKNTQQNPTKSKNTQKNTITAIRCNNFFTSSPAKLSE